MKFIGTATDGQFVPYDKEMYKLYLKKMENKQCVVDVYSKKTRISDPQLRYYYGAIVQPLADYLGYTKDEMDYALKDKFLGEDREKGLRVVPSKLDLSTDESTRYMKAIRIWALTELDFLVPLPEQFSEEMKQSFI